MTIKLTIGRKFFLVSVFLALIIGGFMLKSTVKAPQTTNKARFWNFQSIDTMKWSRDLSREKLNDPTFDVTIERQIKSIADTGATHVGIATPYDEEFLPILKRWVKYARQYNLKVWFRGNFSGWEGWFDYQKIGRAEHIQKTEKFILENSNLFEDGDAFSACPECENGGPGDPRLNGDSGGHKKFLIEEYLVTKKAFNKINKKVDSNYHSMNGDVAKLIMDKETTSKLDGIVVIDHYVKTPEKLVEDINEYAQKSGGKVILGEFGAPIPDINGAMSELEQAEWLTKTMYLLSNNDNVVGMNYWVNTGGSTQIWEPSGKERLAVASLRKAYDPYSYSGSVVNSLSQSIDNAIITDSLGAVITQQNGIFSFASVNNNLEVEVSAVGYKSQIVNLRDNENNKITLEKINPSIIERFIKYFRSPINF